MNGKGMAPRKGYNQKLYAANYDRIFSMNTQTTKPRGRPKVAEDKKRVSYSLSLSRPVADILDGYLAQLQTIPQHKRKGYLFDQICKWLVASHFNPKLP